MAEVDRDEKVPEEDVLKLLDYEGWISESLCKRCRKAEGW
jgi:hypothetical protein